MLLLCDCKVPFTQNTFLHLKALKCNEKNTRSRDTFFLKAEPLTRALYFFKMLYHAWDAAKGHKTWAHVPSSKEKTIVECRKCVLCEQPPRLSILYKHINNVNSFLMELMHVTLFISLWFICFCLIILSFMFCFVLKGCDIFDCFERSTRAFFVLFFCLSFHL